MTTATSGLPGDPTRRFGYVDAADQPVGSVLARPSLVTHPHEAGPLATGVQYALTIWCELPGDGAAF